MPKHVLVPVDGSPQSDRAVAFVIEEWPNAELTLLNVINPVEGGYTATTGVPSGAEEWYEGAKADAEALLDVSVPDVDTAVHTMTEVGRPAQAIVEVAEEGGFDHIVMGSHGRTGVSRILLGSVAEAVIRNATIPVTVVR